MVRIFRNPRRLQNLQNLQESLGIFRISRNLRNLESLGIFVIFGSLQNLQEPSASSGIFDNAYRLKLHFANSIAHFSLHPSSDISSTAVRASASVRHGVTARESCQMVRSAAQRNTRRPEEEGQSGVQPARLLSGADRRMAPFAAWHRSAEHARRLRADPASTHLRPPHKPH